MIQHFNDVMYEKVKPEFGEGSISALSYKLILRQSLKASLHGGGGPHVGEVTHLGGVTRLSI